MDPVGVETMMPSALYGPTSSPSTDDVEPDHARDAALVQHDVVERERAVGRLAPSARVDRRLERVPRSTTRSAR